MSDPAPDRDIANIWSTLRHRKVVQWGIAYVAAAWALLQGLHFLADIYGWPTQMLRLIAASSGTTSTLSRPRRLPLRPHRAHLRFRPTHLSRFCPSPT